MESDNMHEEHPPEAPEPLDPGEMVAELDGSAVVSSGQTLCHGLLLRNFGDRELLVATNGQVTADVVDPWTGEVVGGFVGAQFDPLFTFAAAPGQSTRIPLLIGTASTLRRGHAVPPGKWGVRATLDLRWDDPYGPAFRRRTRILPLAITDPSQTSRPHTRRHRRPGVASLLRRFAANP
jgi:hypothetical protein